MHLQHVKVTHDVVDRLFVVGDEDEVDELGQVLCAPQPPDRQELGEHERAPVRVELVLLVHKVKHAGHKVRTHRPDVVLQVQEVVGAKAAGAAEQVGKVEGLA